LDFDYSRGVSNIAGSVQTQIAGQNGQFGLSSGVNCYPVTMSPTAAPTYHPPYVYISGDICSDDRCSCHNGGIYNCTGNDIVKEFSADNNKTQYVSVRRLPQDFDSTVTVFWEIVATADYIVNNSGSTTGTTTRRLLAVGLSSTTDTPSNKSLGIGISPVKGAIYFNASDIDQKISFIVYKQSVAPGESKYRWYKLNLTMCSALDRQSCTPVYPYTLRMQVDVTGGGEAFSTTKTQKQMPAWLWWLIGALVIFAIILAVLGYRYWWKHKQKSEELVETEDQLEHALEENELGFGKDLGVGDVQFNPMATGVPGQKKAPDLFAGEMEKRNVDASNVRADVAVEKFAHREQFGQQQGLKRGNAGGNDLSQPLLG